MTDKRKDAPEGTPIQPIAEYHNIDHATMLSFAKSYLMQLPDGQYSFYKDGAYWRFRGSVGNEVLNIGGNKIDLDE